MSFKIGFVSYKNNLICVSFYNFVCNIFFAAFVWTFFVLFVPSNILGRDGAQSMKYIIIIIVIILI